MQCFCSPIGTAPPGWVNNLFAKFDRCIGKITNLQTNTGKWTSIGGRKGIPSWAQPGFFRGRGKTQKFQKIFKKITKLLVVLRRLLLDQSITASPPLGGRLFLETYANRSPGGPRRLFLETCANRSPSGPTPSAKAYIRRQPAIL